MRTECPHCGTNYDIKEADVLSAAARILAKRRAKITSAKARSMQALAVRARLANAAKKMLDK